MNILILFLCTTFFTSYCILFWQKISLFSSLVSHKIAYERSYYHARGLLNYAQAYFDVHKHTLFDKQDTVILLFKQWPENVSGETLFQARITFKKEPQGSSITAELFTQEQKTVQMLKAKIML